MEKSPEIGELAAALAIAQGAFAAVERNREVTVTMKSGGKYSFSYATMDAIVDAIRKPLSDNGIAWAQGVEGSDNGTVIETLVMHKSGQWFRTYTPVRIDGSGAQALGSGISYAKRYALTAAVGVVTEDDDDANGADGNEVIVKDTGRPKSNRSADDPEWTGPLGKADLKAKLRDLSTGIDNCADEDALISTLAKNAEIINQCARDLPDWWFYKKGADVGGLKQGIHIAGQQLGIDVSRFITAAETSRAPQ